MAVFAQIFFSLFLFVEDAIVCFIALHAPPCERFFLFASAHTQLACFSVSLSVSLSLSLSLSLFKWTDAHTSRLTHKCAARVVLKSFILKSNNKTINRRWRRLSWNRTQQQHVGNPGIRNSHSGTSTS